MFVYRVQNDLNRGMYRCSSEHSFTANDMDAGPDRFYRHPMPHDDSALMRAVAERGIGLDTITSDDYFGFGSIDQIKRWIYQDDWRVLLDQSGFFIQIWEPFMPAFGDTQAVFIMGSSTKINTLRLTQI